jgi:hypothetical protein
MQNQDTILVTVTTVANNNTFSVPGHLSNIQIMKEVRNRYGAQGVHLDHSFYGQIQSGSRSE